MALLLLTYFFVTFVAFVPYVVIWSCLISNFLLQTFCRALISLRNNGVLLPMVLLDTFFQLFSCPDKVLRKMMYNYIVQDIKNVNTRQKNVQLNKVSGRLTIIIYSLLQLRLMRTVVTRFPVKEISSYSILEFQ